MSKEAGEFGEPWEAVEDGIESKNGLVWEAYQGALCPNDDYKNRIAACVNALAGCPDPQAFVNAVKKYRNRKVPGADFKASAQFVFDLMIDEDFAWLQEKP